MRLMIAWQIERPKPRATLLRREKRIEHALELNRINTFSPIHDRNAHRVPVRLEGDNDIYSPLLRSTTAHRLTAIRQQGLLQLVRKSTGQLTQHRSVHQVRKLLRRC